MTKARSNIVRRNINVTIFVYEDDTARVYIDDPLAVTMHHRDSNRIYDPTKTYDEDQAVVTTCGVIDEWSLWLDVLDVADKIPALREQLDGALTLYHLTRNQ